MTESPDVIIGEVLPDEKADGKKKQLVPRKSDNVAFGSFITKSNDLIQRTKYSLPRVKGKGTGAGLLSFPLHGAFGGQPFSKSWAAETKRKLQNKNLSRAVSYLHN